MEQETKTCKCCNRELTLDQFKNGRWGYTSVCMECENKHRKEMRQKRIDEAKDRIDRERAENRQLCLKDFTPRELMEELSRRGYEGKLRFVKVEEIDITNF